MNHAEINWNQRWQEKSSSHISPDPWLLRAIPFLTQGSVLDIACGRGRNALYLAAKGFTVTGIDISGQALMLLKQEALNRNLAVDLLQWDLESKISLPRGPFDVITEFFYFQRSLFPSIKDALRPGGMVVVRTFSKAGGFPGGPANPDFVLDSGELLDIFSGWEILLHEEGLEQAQKTGGGLAGVVARKPEQGAHPQHPRAKGQLPA